MDTCAHRFYEFFAGGGMARAGLGDAGWRCIFANDVDHKKARIYEANWGVGALATGDVSLLTTADLPDYADLVWASFPCQDLSLAGGGAGLKGDRSGTFWPFWRLMKGLIAEGRAPKLIALENVCGTLTSHNGKDFAAICATFRQSGYRFGALVIDAALFVPQSRPRLFMIGVHADLEIPDELIGVDPSAQWHTKTLRTAYERLPLVDRKNWLWWRLAPPLLNRGIFADVLENEPSGVAWHTHAETERLLRMMSAINRDKVDRAKKAGRRMVGTIYRRTRHDDGIKVQRAEVRFDDVAGCLRTPAGGSSRQTMLIVDGATVMSRLLSSREAARLMGLPDTYILPSNYHEAYHLVGDGVVVPVVRHLAEQLFAPFLANTPALLRENAA